jgi:hypothetical protein
VGRLSPPRHSDGVDLTAVTDLRVLLAAGRPLCEPVAAAGPFVMNTEAQLRQAYDDYRAGRFDPP